MFGKAFGCLSRLFDAVGRKKALEYDQSTSVLAKVLNVFDLTFIGVAATLGFGDILSGTEAKAHAGPAVVISFVIAGSAAILAGLCYAEISSKVPRVGTTYIYSYVTIGEATAFLMGWNYCFIYIVGTANACRVVEGYLDILLDHRIEHFEREYLTHGIPYIPEYIDVFALLLVFTLVAVSMTGVKESAIVVGIMTTINLLTISTAVVGGATKANVSNWNIAKSDIPANYTSIAGNGGFLPFGIEGVMVGAAKCFFGFIGFDCVAMASEEAKKPKRDVPIGIVMTLVIALTTYVPTAIVLTMMRPYYEQDMSTPFPAAFDSLGMYPFKWIVATGTLLTISTGLFTTMMPLPRMICFMARDGLMFKFLGRINSRTKTPIIASLISGLFIGIVVVTLDVSQLISLISMACLLGFVVTAVSVMVLRFKHNPEQTNQLKSDGTTNDRGFCEFFRVLVNTRCQKIPSQSTNDMGKFLICLYLIMSIVTSQYIISLGGSIYDGSAGKRILVVEVLGAVLILILFFLSRQPMSLGSSSSFSLPLGPLIPCVSLYLSTHLMMELDFATWVKFLVWCSLGILFYFTYSIRHSAERTPVADNKVTVESQQR